VRTRLEEPGSTREEERATLPATPPAAASLLELQRTAGNQAVARALAGAATHAVVAREKEDKGFEDVTASAGVSETAAPLTIKLPKEFSEGLEDAYDESFPSGSSQEQSGILVQKPDGSFAWKRNATPGTSGSAEINYDDRAPGERAIATAHTHPYDEKEGGHKGVSFSGADLSTMVDEQERIGVVNAGSKEFVAVKTKEWDTMVAALDDQGKDDLRDEIDALWDKKFKGTWGSLQRKAETATKAVCEKYHLLYYAGKVGGDLERKTQKRYILKPLTNNKTIDSALHALGIGKEAA
jgi:hypothetical protein